MAGSERTTITVDRIALADLHEKCPDADLVREMLGFTAQRLMELQAEELCGAGPGERSPDRVTQHNGYREPGWDTRVGSIGPRIPKLRKGSYFPPFQEPRRTGEANRLRSCSETRKTSSSVWSICTRL